MLSIDRGFFGLLTEFYAGPYAKNLHFYKLTP